jgi:hypothetical protein
MDQQQQQISIDALCNAGKRNFNATIDQLYDIIAQLSKENTELKKQIPEKAIEK